MSINMALQFVRVELPPHWPWALGLPGRVPRASSGRKDPSSDLHVLVSPDWARRSNVGPAAVSRGSRGMAEPIWHWGKTA